MMKAAPISSRTQVSSTSFVHLTTSRCPACRRPLVLVSRSYSAAQSFVPRQPRRSASGLAQAVATAQHIISNGTKTDPRLAGVAVDPLRAVAKEMKFLTQNIQKLLGSGHPLLDTVSKYYAQSEGKHIRPLLVLLMSQATARSSARNSTTASDINSPISPQNILSDINPSLQGPSVFHPLEAGVTEPSSSLDSSQILPSQRRLAEITELIHTASLLHDDVIDSSETRRSSPSANVAFGNKVAVLAGDFLLGRASAALARLRNAEVIELLATVIANLVEGEFMQLRNTSLDEAYPVWTEDALSYYLQKTYLKSASLISKSCRAAALLGQSSSTVVEAAYSYGKNLGLAFQLIDDMLDYTIPREELGKPSGADLELGLATAPLLFAWKDNHDLGPLVGRKFAMEGDIQLARDIVLRSGGLEQTRALAQEYANKAIDAIRLLPSSEGKDGLIEMCFRTMNRRK